MFRLQDKTILYLQYILQTTSPTHSARVQAQSSLLILAQSRSLSCTFLKARPWTEGGTSPFEEKVDPTCLLTLSVLDVAVTVLVTYCSNSSTRRTQRNLSPPTVEISWARIGRRRCSGTWGKASTNTRMIFITTSSTLPEDSDKSLSSAYVQRGTAAQTDDRRWVQVLSCKFRKRERKHYMTDNSIAKAYFPQGKCKCSKIESFQSHCSFSVFKDGASNKIKYRKIGKKKRGVGDLKKEPPHYLASAKTSRMFSRESNAIPFWKLPVSLTISVLGFKGLVRVIQVGYMTSGK